MAVGYGFSIGWSVEPQAHGGDTTQTPPTVKPWSVPLAGRWQARLVTPLPASPGLDKVHPDAGVSDAAKALVKKDLPQDLLTAHPFQEVSVPSGWESYGPEWVGKDGEAVYRRTVEISPDIVGKDLELHLSAIDDFDDTFVNGVLVGRTDKNVVGFWAARRIYRIPGGLVEAGSMTIAVRIFDHFGAGGFLGGKDDMVLKLAH